VNTRLRNNAWINPPTGGFEALPPDMDVTFMPLEAVWSGDGADVSRTRPVEEVASGYVRFMEGDVLCPKVTPTFQAGRSMVVPPIPNQVGAATTEVHVVRPKTGLADPRFLMYRLLTQDFLSEGVSRFQGVAGLQRVPAEFLMDLPVADLPVEEQRRIADFLDDQVARIDGLVQHVKTLVDLLGERFDAEVDAAVTRGTRDGAPVRETGIVGLELVPKHWDIRQLRTIGIARIGLTYSPNDEVENPEQGTFVIRAGNIQGGRIVQGDDVYVDKVIPGELVLRLGDIVMCSRNGSARLIGKSARVGPENVGQSWGAFMTVFRSHANDYLEWVFRSSLFKSQLGRYATSTINQLTRETLLSFRVPFPPDEERAQIREALESRAAGASDLLNPLGVQLSQLEERKRALITAAVTGALDVTTAKPIGMGKWVPNVGAGVEAPALVGASSIGGIG